MADLFKKIAFDGSLESIRTDSGGLTVRRNMGGGIYRYIHSTVDPEREAGIWADCQPAPKANTVILGCGLGYHVIEFLKRYRNVKHVYLIEADEPLFRLASDASDISKAVDSVITHFLIGPDVNSVKQTLSNLLDNLFTYHVFFPATSLHPEFYASVIRSLDEHLLTMRLTAGGNNDSGMDNLFATGVKKLIDEMKDL